MSEGLTQTHCLKHYLFLSGIIDAKPQICIDSDYIVTFTDKRPNPNNENIILCVPAAYSDENGVIGHYSTGVSRKGDTNFGYTTVRLPGGTYFQQLTLVKNHKPRQIADNKFRYRRALCKKGRKFAIEHSKYPITLSEFAKTLENYDSAWNLDMGTYAYGWYREDGKFHHLGLSTIWNKQKQTNWIVVKKK